MAKLLIEAKAHVNIENKVHTMSKKVSTSTENMLVHIYIITRLIVVLGT